MEKNSVTLDELFGILKKHVKPSKNSVDKSEKRFHYLISRLEEKGVLSFEEEIELKQYLPRRRTKNQY